MVFENPLSEHALASERKPRVQTFDRLLYVQVGMYVFEILYEFLDFFPSLYPVLR